MEAERLLKNGRSVRLQPQPFRLLCLLASQPSRLISREEIRTTLWTSDTFVDFEQGVNFAVKQVREALGEDADHPIYIQTIPKRGYKFVAPVEVVGPTPGQEPPKRTDLALHKLLWTHIAELRLAEENRRKRRRALMVGLSTALAVAAIAALVFFGVLRR